MTLKRGLFITGTDTGVGKTYVAVRIADELRRRGIDVGVMKPAETGCRKRNGRLYPSDAARLKKAARVRDKLVDINPYRFSLPLAPSVAAELEGRHIDPKKMLNAFHKLLEKHEYVIVEGAGGIMAPLSENYSYLDLAGNFDLPVLIVARPGLGTINHTLLTIAALKQRKLKIAGVVINYSDDRKAGQAERTNPAIIENVSGIKILGIVQYRSRKILHIVDKL